MLCENVKTHEIFQISFTFTRTDVNVDLGIYTCETCTISSYNRSHDYICTTYVLLFCEA